MTEYSTIITWYMLRDATDRGGWSHAEVAHVVIEGALEANGEIPRRLAVLTRTVDDLVVHVRHAHREAHLEVEIVLEQPPHDVERYVRPRVAEMRDVVDGGAARVPRHDASLAQLQRLARVAQAVVQGDCGAAARVSSRVQHQTTRDHFFYCWR